MIIALDPSGNFKEGKGTTGIFHAWSTGEIHKVAELKASDYDSAEDYWEAHIRLLGSVFEVAGDLEVVMEGFKLYGHKSKQQTNSEFETPMLIGVIRYWCHISGVPLKIQFASDVKTRWSDSVLEAKGIIEIRNGKRYLVATGQALNNHKTDALRHGMHYITYTREKHLGG
jgi:hypothetical protein